MSFLNIATKSAMPRFAPRCVALLSALFLASPALAVNSVVVESKTFAAGQTACSVGVFITNDVPIVGIVVPLELRTIEGGAYITGPFPASFKFQAVPGNRLDSSPLGSAGDLWPDAIRVTSMFATPATSGELCSGPVSRSYTQATTSVDAVSPDAVFHVAISTGDPSIGEEIVLQPGADPASTSDASLRFIFNVNLSTGYFRIDTCCRTPGGHLAMVGYSQDGPVTEVPLDFVRGLLTIGEGGDVPDSNSLPTAVCRDSIVVYTTTDCFASLGAEDVDNGSWDTEDGTNLAMVLAPPGPYRIGRHQIRLFACDQEGDCASCSTVVIVRDSIPVTLTVDRDTVFLEFRGDTGMDHLCEEVTFVTTGCNARISATLGESVFLADVDIKERLAQSQTITICVSPFAGNVPNGVYYERVIARLLARPERDTITIVITVDHPPFESACDSVCGFVKSLSGDPIEHAFVWLMVCDSAQVGCGTIPGQFHYTDSSGSFCIPARGWRSLKLMVTAPGYIPTEIPVTTCDEPIYAYMEVQDVADPGANPPPGAAPPCVTHGFVFGGEEYEIVGAIVQLWDSYPGGVIVAEDTTDSFGHFGVGVASGTLVAKAKGYCPKVITEFGCSTAAQIVTLDPIPYADPPNWPLFCDYYSTGARFVAGGVPYPIMPGDVIYATDPQGIICGITWVEDNGTYLIHVLGDDPETPVDEGMVEGDSVTLWLNCDCAVVAPQNWVNFGSFRFDALWDCEIVPLCCSLCEGWNMWSYNISLSDYARADVLSTIDLSYDAVRSGLCDYGSISWFDGRPINDLEDVSPWFGYDIHMLQEDTVCLMGEPVDPSTPIALCAGWNYIPYLPESADNLAHALQSLDGNVAHIFSMYCDYGVASWNVAREPQNNDLNCMEPCKGYWIEMISDDTLIYPEPEGCDPLAKVGTRSLAGRVTATPLVADYYAPASKTPAGSVISARSSSGALIGEASVGANGSFLIHVYGDVPFTASIEGAIQGESITFEIDGIVAVCDRDIRWTDRDNQQIALSAGVTGVLPTEYALLQNYPNPFNAGTVISFDLKDEAAWTLSVYNVMGQRVRDFAGQSAAGRISVRWDGRSELGQQLASGVYFYRLSANEYTDFKKMTLVK